METWSAHHLYREASKQLDKDTVTFVQRYANNLRNRRLPVIFSLGHLGKITGIRYDFLHESVNRKRESTNYNMFSFQKRSGGRRFIHAVNGKLYDLQKYINKEVLQKAEPHPSSHAFHAFGGIRICASMHCGCKWLLQFDLTDFFYTVSETAVFEVFVGLGYRPLLAFELARLCTTLRLPKSKHNYLNRNDLSRHFSKYLDGKMKFPYCQQKLIGVLPQGAPTSPMLSNLVAQKLDVTLFDYAQENGFIYTRYADDLAFSASALPKGKSIAKLKREIVSLIRKNGFRENCKKIRIAGPGSKKVVLGLLIDGEQPRLTREFRKRIDRNIYSIEKYGIEAVAENDGFDSVYGFFNHVSGLMSFVHDVDLDLWESMNPRFQKIKSTLEQ
jgi:RNA-directed DNA polymerase